jgi:hypothetical protein
MGNIFGNKSSQEDWKKSKPIEKGFTETSNTAQNPPTVNRNAVAAARAARAARAADREEAAADARYYKTTFKTKLDGADVDDLTNDFAKQFNSELVVDGEINEKINKKRQELKILENNVKQMLKAHEQKIKKAQAARQAAQQAARQDNQDTTETALETNQRKLDDEYKYLLKVRKDFEKKRRELEEAEEAEKNRKTIKKKRKEMKRNRKKATIKAGGRNLRFL